MRIFSVGNKLLGEAFSFVYCDSNSDMWEAARHYKIHGYVSLTFSRFYGIMFSLIRYIAGVTAEISAAMICGRLVAWPQFWPSTELDYVETVRIRAPKSIDFGLKSPEKPCKSREKPAQISSGTGGREFESRHFDQTLLIRTFEIPNESWTD